MDSTVIHFKYNITNLVAWKRWDCFCLFFSSEKRKGHILLAIKSICIYTVVHSVLSIKLWYFKWPRCFEYYIFGTTYTKDLLYFYSPLEIITKLVTCYCSCSCLFVLVVGRDVNRGLSVFLFPLRDDYEASKLLLPLFVSVCSCYPKPMSCLLLTFWRTAMFISQNNCGVQMRKLRCLGNGGGDPSLTFL